MQLNETLAFVTVVEAGSFTAAGARLSIPKSTLSRQVSRLESRLGTRLLQRTTRKLTLTELGRAYYGRCKQAIDDIADAERVALDVADQARGHLRVSAPYEVGFDHVVPLLGEFRAQYPDITLELVLSQGRVDMVAEGYDVALRGGELPDADFISRKLFSGGLVLCASPDYLARRGEPQTLADLETHDGILMRLPPTESTWRVIGPEGPVPLPLRAWFTTNAWSAIVDSLVRGLGIGLLVDHMAEREYAQGRLAPVLPAYGLPPGGLFAIYPSRHHLSPKVRVFVDFLAARLPETLLNPVS